MSIALKHLPGKHDQSSHGRDRGAKGAYRSSYSSARQGGASVQEARTIAREASSVVKQEQREAHRVEVAKRREERVYAERERQQYVYQHPEGGSIRKGQREGINTSAYGQDSHTKYNLKHKLVDMGDIRASNTANGGINPDYDAALQPRDRSRQSSQAQIEAVSRKLNPDVLTTDFHRIDAGSPIIDSEGNVLSGNGRTLALQKAIGDNPEKYQEYRESIRKQAIALGIDPNEVDRMKNPVLVRELQGDTDRVAFAREANQSGTLRMSPLEQAKVDAQELRDSAVLKMNIREGQGIDQALRDPSNRPFVKDFLSTVPDNERANLLTRDGDLNQMGLYRMKAAMYTKVFPGESGSRMAESMLESLDPDLKTIQNGISSALPALSRARSLIHSGQRDENLDLTDDFAVAIDTLARVRSNPSFTTNTPMDQVVKKFLAQQSLFGEAPVTPRQAKIMTFLDQNIRKQNTVRDFFNTYANAIDRQPAKGQGGMFDDRMTGDDLLDYAIRQQEGANQAMLFKEKKEEPKGKRQHLPPVPKRDQYADVSPDDLVFALFYDRIMPNTLD